MRKLLLFLVLLVSSTTLFAQPPTALGVRVINNSSCVVYYRIVGDELCKCGQTYSSPIIALPPGGTILYPNSTTLGGSYPPGINKSVMGAYVYSGPVSCSATLIRLIGQSYCSLPAVFGYTALTANCAGCTPIQAVWTTTPNCETGIAQLRFN